MKVMKNLFARLVETMGWVWFLIMWMFPPILVGIGWVMPSLHQKVSLPVPDTALRGILILFIIAVTGLIVQTMTASSPRTHLGALQLDQSVSIGWALILAAFAGVMYGKADLEWWVMLPTAYSGLEALLGGVFGLRNAFQKNPTQLQKSDQ